MFKRFWILNAIVIAGFTAYQGHLRNGSPLTVAAIYVAPVAAEPVGSFVSSTLALALAARFGNGRLFRIGRLETTVP